MSRRQTKDSRTRRFPCRSPAQRSPKAEREHARRHRREEALRHLEPEAANLPLQRVFHSARRCSDQSTHRLRTRHWSSNRFRRTCGRHGLRPTRRRRTHRTGNHSAPRNQTEQTEAQSQPHHSSHPTSTRNTPTASSAMTAEDAHNAQSEATIFLFINLMTCHFHTTPRHYTISAPPRYTAM